MCYKKQDVCNLQTQVFEVKDKGLNQPFLLIDFRSSALKWKKYIY